MDVCYYEMKGGPRKGQPCGKPVYRCGECRHHYKKTNVVYKFHVKEQETLLSLSAMERVKKYNEHKSFYHQSLAYIANEDKRRIAYRENRMIGYLFHTVGPMTEQTCSICYTSEDLLAFPCHKTHIACYGCLSHLANTVVESRNNVFVHHDSVMKHTFQCPLCREVLLCESQPM